MLKLNQLAKGKAAGLFVVLGFRIVGGVQYAQLKSVNPADHSQVAPGELCLPVDCLEALP